MNTDNPHNLRVMTPNDDGTYTCKEYEFDPHTRERKQVGEAKQYRRATEHDREAHARGELKGRTLTAYNPDEVLSPFLLVCMEET